MSSSLDGSVPGSTFARTNCAFDDATKFTAVDGFHVVAGERSGGNSTFRGPTRRSSVADSVRPQLSAIIVRSSALFVTCISFSADAKSFALTVGPTTGAVPNATGAPGVEGVPLG